MFLSSWLATSELFNSDFCFARSDSVSMELKVGDSAYEEIKCHRLSAFLQLVYWQGCWGWSREEASVLDTGLKEFRAGESEH